MLYSKEMENNDEVEVKMTGDIIVEFYRHIRH